MSETVNAKRRISDKTVRKFAELLIHVYYTVSGKNVAQILFFMQLFIGVL